MDKEDKLYYIFSGDYVGNAMVWEGPHRSGYVCNINNAGKYTYREAMMIIANNDKKEAWECSYIDARTIPIVDGQHLSSKSAGGTGNKLVIPKRKKFIDE